MIMMMLMMTTTTTMMMITIIIIIIKVTIMKMTLTDVILDFYHRHITLHSRNTCHSTGSDTLAYSHVVQMGGSAMKFRSTQVNTVLPEMCTKLNQSPMKEGRKPEYPEQTLCDDLTKIQDTHT